MATARLQAKLSMDDSAFQAGLRKASQAAAQFASRTAAVFAGSLGADAFKAAITKISSLLVDVSRKALELGGKFNDLAAQTGGAVSQLAILELAFDNAGVGGDQLGAVINKLQKAVEDGGPAISNLGMDLDALKKMSPDKQLIAVGKAIVSLKTPAEQTAATMAIFGKSGGKLLAVFKDGGALDNARVVLGSAPKILEENIKLFDDMGDSVSNLSSKWDAFAVGITSKIAPAIMPLLDKMMAVDTAAFGQALAEDITDALSGKSAAAGIGELGGKFVKVMAVAALSVSEILGAALMKAFVGPIAWFQSHIENAVRQILRATGQDTSVDIEKINEDIRKNAEARDRWGTVPGSNGEKGNEFGAIMQNEIDRLIKKRDDAISYGNVAESRGQIEARIRADGAKAGWGEGSNAEEIIQRAMDRVSKAAEENFPKATEAVKAEMSKAASPGSATPAALFGPPIPPAQQHGPPLPMLGPEMPKSWSGVEAHRNLQNSESSWEKLQKTATVGVNRSQSAMDAPVSVFGEPNTRDGSGRRTTVSNQERAKKILGATATKAKKEADAAAKAQMSTAEGVSKIVSVLGGK